MKLSGAVLLVLAVIVLGGREGLTPKEQLAGGLLVLAVWLVVRHPSAGWLIPVALALGAWWHFTLREEIAAGLAGLLGWYAWSCRRRPARRCWWCGGSGVRQGSDPEIGFKRKSVRKCWVCRNVKVNPRWGTRIVNRSDRRKLIRERNARPPGGV